MRHAFSGAGPGVQTRDGCSCNGTIRSGLAAPRQATCMGRASPRSRWRPSRDPATSSRFGAVTWHGRGRRWLSAEARAFGELPQST